MYAYIVAVPAKTVKTRLSSEDRRKMILHAALNVFAESGFHGTTTKALARTAGVSEALIFRHFPSKDKLYSALQEECCRMKADDESERVMSLEPSTSTLVIMVHFFIGKMLRASRLTDEVEHQIYRMMTHSFMEDGEFARRFMHHVADNLIAKMEASVRAAGKAGDLVESPVIPNLRAWFVEHLGAMLMLNQISGKPVVDFKQSKPEQLEQAVWFALLGMGLKAEAIRRNYNPKALALLAG